MAWLATVEFALGLAVTVTALFDVFTSILTPGTSAGWLSVAGRVRFIALPLWRGAVQYGNKGGRQRYPNGLAPFLLSVAFLSWLVLLWIGFGLMIHASASLFTPALSDFSQALYVAGCSILTLGVSEVDAHGAARWIILSAALAGFSIISATVTFILQVQTALHQREALVLTLTGVAGRPPTGIALLETFARLGIVDDLSAFFLRWRDWSAATLHSHAAHPVLVYFHSVDAESDWLPTLHTVLDAATLIATLTDEPSAGHATLLHRTGSKTASRLCALLALENKAPAQIVSEDEVAVLVQRLRVAGFKVASRGDGCQTFARQRSDYASKLEALGLYLGASQVTLLPSQHGSEGEPDVMPPSSAG